MMCGYMQKLGKIYVPCGKCDPCNYNKKRLWTGRIILESINHPAPSAFVTLTYDDHNLPDQGEVSPPDVMAYIKRLRQQQDTGKVRYFAVGEYGDKTFRAHYHLALFGLPAEVYETTLRKTWQEFGHVHVGELTPASSSYIAGYTTKKMTKGDDYRLDGRHPEFTRMSKFPPLGAPGIAYIENLMYTRVGAAGLQKTKDVPTGFQHEGKTYPIGRYWRHHLREQIGINEPPAYQPWVVDLPKFKKDMKNAEKIAQKLYSKRRETRSGRTL